MPRDDYPSKPYRIPRQIQGKSPYYRRYLSVLKHGLRNPVAMKNTVPEGRPSDHAFGNLPLSPRTAAEKTATANHIFYVMDPFINIIYAFIYVYNNETHKHTHIYIHRYIYIYRCISI